jgi:hypothetical protein
LFDDVDDVGDFEAELVVAVLGEELLEVLLCALHYDVGVFFAIVLVAFHFGD